MATLFIVGLTGGIASGKSTASAFFKDIGVPVVDADAISRALTLPGGLAIEPIAQTFGQTMIDETGALNRARMRQLVFSDAQAKKQLEAILHPLIHRQTKQALQAINPQTHPIAIYDCPLLLESPYWRHFTDHILLIDAPVDLQIERVMARSGLSADMAQKIIQNQMPRSEKIRWADSIIVNNSGLEDLRNALNLFWNAFFGFFNRKTETNKS